MKQFSIVKVGYTSGIYGCSGEYFNCIFTDKKGLQNFTFSGMYGADERVQAEMREKGYKQVWLKSDYGKMKTSGQDKMLPIFMGEYQAIEYIKNGFKE
jgi:hypothetical protein